MNCIVRSHTLEYNVRKGKWFCLLCGIRGDEVFKTICPAASRATKECVRAVSARGGVPSGGSTAIVSKRSEK